MSEIIEQEHYPDIKFDDSEQDIVMLVQAGESELDLTMIERNNIAKVVLTLIKLHPECRDEVSEGMR